MKTITKPILMAALALAVFWSAGAALAQTAAAAPEKDKTNTPAAAPSAAAPASDPDRKLRLNFRGVPLEMVLDYLSEAAGFIIIKETEVKGKVDVWSSQPLSTNEAVDLLNTILNKNEYAAIRNGRTLTIVARDEAKKRDIPVKKGADTVEMPKSDEMVTQILPVRHANVTQLTANLQPLLGTYATMTANESANTLVLTATQADVRRMAEIVNALDESIANTSALRVFPLRYADAKELANVVKELFAPTQQQQTGNRGGNAGGNPFAGGFQAAAAAFGQGGGFGGRGGGGGAGGGGGGRGGSAAGSVNGRVVAVADERSNSLVVGAPEDMMSMIADVVKQIDQPTTDITELRVFRLHNSDPNEIANMLATLFPDETKTANNQQQQQFRFGGGPFGGGGFGGGARGGAGNGASTPSDRMKKQGRVLAVPDPRTDSVIVSAASELMPQIAGMINQLDSSPARKQKVFVYSVENADVQQVEQILRGMFERTTTQNNRNNNQNRTSALSDRSSTGQGTGTGNRNTGTGNTGFGGGGGGFGNQGR